MTPVSFVKTTESGIIRGLSIWSPYGKYIFPEITKTGLITSTDQTVRAVHSCKRLFGVTFQTVRQQPGKYKLISSKNRIIIIAI